MGDHRAIANAGESLVSLLQTHVALDEGSDAIVLGKPGALVGSSSPRSQSSTTPRLSVYLYQVVPTSSLRNAPREVADAEGAGDPTKVTAAPLALDLHYLVTAYPSGGSSGSGTTAETVDQHHVLGWALQALAENSVLEDADLQGSLAGDPPIDVTLEHSPFENVVDVWSTFPDQPYEPSASYILSPVLVKPTESESGQRVNDRTIDTVPVDPNRRADTNNSS